MFVFSMFFMAMTPIPVVPLLSAFQAVVIAVRFAPLFEPLTISTILAIVPVVVVTMVPVVVTPIVSVTVIPVAVFFPLLIQIGRCRLASTATGALSAALSNHAATVEIHGASMSSYD